MFFMKSLFLQIFEEEEKKSDRLILKLCECDCCYQFQACQQIRSTILKKVLSTNAHRAQN